MFSKMPPKSPPPQWELAKQWRRRWTCHRRICGKWRFFSRHHWTWEIYCRDTADTDGADFWRKRGRSWNGRLLCWESGGPVAGLGSANKQTRLFPGDTRTREFPGWRRVSRGPIPRGRKGSTIVSSAEKKGVLLEASLVTFAWQPFWFRRSSREIPHRNSSGCLQSTKTYLQNGGKLKEIKSRPCLINWSCRLFGMHRKGWSQRWISA